MVIIKQDIEQGLADPETIIPSTEEAIDVLIKSYKASANYEQVRSQVAEICKQVSIMAPFNDNPLFKEFRLRRKI